MKADFPPGWSLTFTFRSVGLHIYSKEMEGFETTGRDGELICGGLHMPLHFSVLEKNVGPYQNDK